ncbi:hypothetical protein [Rhizobium sp. SG741]|jgi:hypothetical protein|uniref:hypothetical protein n=1 Tax=Rhizobium sp. SG741 TaxID=2587114 RepID=UPI00055F115E|nr:hypothetical protein [Rhizobium sp. SG741]NKJ07528.1 hypothetical protein [Rhizobium sp. SG741]
MKILTAIAVSSMGLVGLMTGNNGSDAVTKGPRITHLAVISAERTRIQQSRARLDALRGALLQQKARLRAKSANDGVVLPV